MPTLCEAFMCYDPGDPYDCLRPGSLVVDRRYACPQHASMLNGAYARVIPVAVALSGPPIVQLTPRVAPGTLCSVIGCVSEAVFEGKGLFYDGSHFGSYGFSPFHGALCERHYKAGYTPQPEEWDAALAGSWP